MTVFAGFSTERPAQVFSDVPAAVLRYNQGASTGEAQLSSAQTAEAFTYRTCVLELEGSRLHMPVAVDVRRTRSYVSVSEPESGIYGVGDTTSAAMEDFCHALRDFQDVLAGEQHLAPSLRRLQAQLLLLSGK